MCLAWHPIWRGVARSARVRPGTVWAVFAVLRDRPPGPLDAATIAAGFGWRADKIALVLDGLAAQGIVDADGVVVAEWLGDRPVTSRGRAADVMQDMPDVMPPSMTRHDRRPLKSIEELRAADRERIGRWRAAAGVSPREWRDLREEVFARDDRKCVKCGAGDRLHCDHIIELTDGGDSSVDNLQTLCQSCHSRKTGASRAVRANVMPDVMPVMPPLLKERDQDLDLCSSEAQARDPLGNGWGSQAEETKTIRAARWLAATLQAAQAMMSHDRFVKLYSAAYTEPRPKWAQLELDRIDKLVRAARGPPPNQGSLKLPYDGGRRAG